MTATSRTMTLAETLERLDRALPAAALAITTAETGPERARAHQARAHLLAQLADSARAAGLSPVATAADIAVDAERAAARAEFEAHAPAAVRMRQALATARL